MSEESPYPDLGPNPFMDAPSGSGPTGSFGFNPYYFPTEETAQKIADMLGGKVVPQHAILSSPGSPFHQNQMNYMVELPNGRTINPGFIAQAIASGQPRNNIDALIYSEVNDVGIAVGQAPEFVPVNRPSQSAPPPPSLSAPSTNQTAAASSWSNIHQMTRDTQAVLGSDSTTSDASILALQEKMDQVRQMLQVFAQLLSIRAEKTQSSGQGLRNLYSA